MYLFFGGRPRNEHALCRGIAFIHIGEESRLGPSSRIRVGLAVSEKLKSWVSADLEVAAGSPVGGTIDLGNFELAIGLGRQRIPTRTIQNQW